jgi:hypothetical protein
MWIANLIVLLVIAGCAAYQYLKGTLVKSFVTIITAICAGIAAFSYFEILADVFISRSANTRYLAMVPWAQPLAFVLLFVLAFAILQTIVARLIRQKIDLGLLPERIGRVVCGVFLGLMLSGLLLTALAMAPLPSNYPYQRFDATMPDAEEPDKVLLNADGFATGWFSTVSSGSFSGKRSFATLHAGFLDQVFLNRLGIADKISVVTSSPAIEVPKKKAAWPASENLKDSSGNPISQRTGHNLIIVRVGMRKAAVREAGEFTLSQLRLICKQKSYSENPLAGRGRNVYPVGYLKTADQLQPKKLNDRIRVKISDFKDKMKWIDFVFYVPNDFLPVLVEFKQNSIVEVPPLISAEQAPPTVPFTDSSEGVKESADAEARKFHPGYKRKSSGKKSELSNVGKHVLGDRFDE